MHLTAYASYGSESEARGYRSSVDAPAFCFCFCCCCCCCSCCFFCCCCLPLFLQPLRTPPVLCVRLLTIAIVCLAPDIPGTAAAPGIPVSVCGCDPWRARKQCQCQHDSVDLSYRKCRHFEVRRAFDMSFSFDIYVSHAFYRFHTPPGIAALFRADN